LVDLTLFLHSVAFVLSPDVDVVLASFRDHLHDPAPRRDALDPPAVFLCIRVLRSAASVRRMLHSRSHELYDLESHGLKVSNDQILIFLDLGES
jgi:hypothetical protein